MVKGAVKENLSDYFSKSVYQKARPTANGRWLRDKNNEEYAMGSFLAVPADQLRVGVYFLDLLKGRVDDPCLVSYAREMVKKTVGTPAKPAVYGTDTGYGYQIWTNMTDLPNDVVEMRGYGGQNIYVSPTKDSVFLVVTAADFRPDEQSMSNSKRALKELLLDK